MTFRDLRNFAEMMRALGYPRLISVENFRNPNFTLVAEILAWLVQRFDPGTELTIAVSTEKDRVAFIRTVAHFLLTKGQVRVNTKKLYQADGYAVKELLKITTVLYDASKIKVDESDLEVPDEENYNFSNVDIASKINEIKQMRHLATQITTRGATLYNLLQREVELRELRSLVLTKQVEVSQVEGGIRKAIDAVGDEIKNAQSQMDNVVSNEANLDNKIKKKQLELERNEKRLQTLRKVRPAFMDEFEKLEVELKVVYSEYVTKLRCLNYLERILDDYDRVEQEKMEERQAATKKIMERIRHEDFSLNSLEGDVPSGDESDDEQEIVKEPRPKKGRKSAAGSKGVGLPAGMRRVFGSMTGGDDESESLGSDSDLILEGEGDDGSDLGSESDELEVENPPMLNGVGPNPTKDAVISDDDF